MTRSGPATRPPLPRWPFLALLALVPACAWTLAGHQPAPRPDAATPWFDYTLGLTPAARAVDALERVLPLGGDLTLAAGVVLTLLGLCVLATLMAADVPIALALAVTIGTLAMPPLWGTVGPGSDAVPVLVMATIVLARFLPRARLLGLVGGGLGVTLAAPWVGWAIAPSLVIGGAGRRRVALPLLLLVAAGVALLLQFRASWATVPCLPDASWTTHLRDVILPGLAAGGSARVALTQWLSVIAGDVHAFGLVTATWGLLATRTAPAGASAATGATVAALAVTVATGALPPAFAAALLLPWWAVWFGRGLTHLVVATTSGRARAVALAGGVLLAVAVPVLRHATVVPAAWVAGLPATTRAVAASRSPAGMVTAVEPHRLRQLRMAGVPTLPLDAAAVGACQAARTRIDGIGDAVAALDLAGLPMREAPLDAPLAAVLSDLRQRQVVALGLSSTALPYAGRQTLDALEHIGISRTVPATAQVGTITRTGSLDARVQVARHGLELRVEAADPLGGLPLSHALIVNVQPDMTVIDAPPQRLVESRAGGLVVLDREESLVFRGAVDRLPGLPLSLRSHPAWRRAAVQGPSACVPLRDGVAVVGPARRISVPTAAASTRHPVVVYLTAGAPASVGVAGLPVRTGDPQWRVDTFDRRRTGDDGRLRARLAGDLLDGGTLPSGQHVTRIELRPTDAWHAPRVALSAGLVADGWLVSAPAAGRTQGTAVVCTVHSGDRLLGGQFGVMDDDARHEIPVWAIDGWHRTEQSRRDVFQWSAATRATVGFRLDAPRPLALALDAGAIATPGGPQPLMVRINGHLLESDWTHAHRTTIPESFLRAGDNLLELAVREVVQPPGDPRTLGVLVRQLRLIASPGA